MNPEHVAAQIILRSWPFPRGAGRLLDRLFSKLQFSQSIVQIRTSDGFDMFIHPNEFIGRHLYLMGEFDRSVVEVLLRLSKPNDVLLDIGANIGYVSACFLAKVASSQVIAVEPQADAFGLLVRNLAQFGADRFSTYEVALSNANGQALLSVHPLYLGHSRIVQSDGIPVTTWSPDRLIEKANPLSIDLIKIDVEGHELEVIRGCHTLMSRYKPRAIIFEDHTKSAHPGGPIGSLLNGFGYRLLGIEKHLTRLKFVPILSQSNCVYNDYVALRPTELPF